jgi:hypothetical protein
MTESWRNWEGEVINGTFALHRSLGSSENSAVFLTEQSSQNLSRAAIKLVAVDPSQAQARLSNWRATSALRHPHLTRLFDVGQVAGTDQTILFVVMEYADETLAELLPQRALTADEARGMLLPVLDALAFVHGENRVLGQIKPSNVMVVHDQVKLAADTIQPPGRLGGVTASAVYAAPEARGGQFSRASDVWSLGVTVVEALTRHPPPADGGRVGVASLSSELPQDFVSFAVRCLNQNPAVRPSPQQLKAWITHEPVEAAPTSIPAATASLPDFPERRLEPAAREEPALAAAAAFQEWGTRDESSRPGSIARRRASASPQRSLGLYVAALAVLALIWGGSHLLQGERPAAGAVRLASPSGSPAARAAPPQPGVAIPAVSPPPSNAAGAAPPPAPPPAPAPAPAPTGYPELPGVLHEELPLVPRSAADTIHGRFGVVVRVTVDRSGSVVDESLEDAGPSRYFAHLAGTAARQWKFAPDGADSRQWLLKFGFSRDQTTAAAETVAAP